MQTDTALTLANTYSSNQHYVVSLWFKHSGLSAQFRPLFGIGNPNSDGLLVSVSAGKVIFGNNTGSGMKQANYTFNNATWYNVSLVANINGNVMEMYVNGSLLDQNPMNGYAWNNSHTLTIGSDAYSTFSGFYADPNMTIGNLIIDNVASADYATYISYNYDAWRSSVGINGKY